MNEPLVEETVKLLQNKNYTNEDNLTKNVIQKEITNRNRCLPSRRLLSQATIAETSVISNNILQQPLKEFPIINFIHTVRPNWPPSRKREEARILENLQKLIERSKLFKANQTSGSEATTVIQSTQINNGQYKKLENRPQLLTKILLSRPINVYHDVSDFETNWWDSEFITECLCWHNVYRQRHNSRPLTMAPQPAGGREKPSSGSQRYKVQSKAESSLELGFAILCEYAQTWANHLAHTNTFYYRNDREVGQNLYCRPGGPVSGDVGGQDVSSYWYSAVKHYNFFKEPDILHTNVNTDPHALRL
ncbi:uncharacterized protein LOC141536652 isoform X3 [Cotesia typhae]|uniref:uncharacterized protein LOC141536652 isoform X3 n=1 Tax=Cotesia typhae TaxID=2053667 RepID=UPI003D687B1A